METATQPQSHTHWKKLINPEYIGAYSLEDGQDLTVTITEVKRELIVGTGGKKEECTVAYLKGQKPFILNRTNCKTITAIYKTPFIEEWKGKAITLFASTTKLGSDMVECLRIRNTMPSLPELSPESPKWKGAVDAMAAGKVTIEKIEAQYYLSPENRILLITQSKPTA